MWALIHETCGQVAFYVVDRPIRGREVPLAKDHRLIDGSIPTDGGEMRCGSCGQKISYEQFDPEKCALFVDRPQWRPLYALENN